MCTVGRAEKASALKPDAPLRELQQAFREAGEADLAALVGVHDGEFLGPTWFRHGGC